MTTNTTDRLAVWANRTLGRAARPGLILAIGELEDGKAHPTRLDHFRAKPGAHGQYQRLADRFHEVYGATPKRVDITLAAPALRDCLDIRLKAYAGGGDGQPGYLRALGATNYAEDPDALAGPVNVRVWQPNGGVNEQAFASIDDPALGALGCEVYTTFRFLIPPVTGLTTWAELVTKGKVSTDNLWESLRRLYAMTGGHTFGLKLRLTVGPTTGTYVDKKDGKRKRSTYFAVDVETPYTVSEFHAELARLQQVALAGGGPQPAALPPVVHDDADRDAEVTPGLWPDGDVVDALAVPVPQDEPAAVKTSPADTGQRERGADGDAALPAGSSCWNCGTWNPDDVPTCSACEHALVRPGPVERGTAPAPAEASSPFRTPAGVVASVAPQPEPLFATRQEDRG